MQIVEGVVEGLEFRFTAVAGSRVDVTDVKAAAKHAPDHTFERVCLRGHWTLAPLKVFALANRKRPILGGGERARRAHFHTQLAGDAPSVVELDFAVADRMDRLGKAGLSADVAADFALARLKARHAEKPRLAIVPDLGHAVLALPSLEPYKVDKCISA